MTIFMHKQAIGQTDKFQKCFPQRKEGNMLRLRSSKGANSFVQWRMVFSVDLFRHGTLSLPGTMRR